MPMARPTKYKPEYCDFVIELMKEGASKAECSAAIGIHKDTLYEWIKKYPKFSDSIKRGQYFSLGWWERQGRINLENKSFNYTGWYMQMKNRHGWSDKHEISGNKEQLKIEVEFVGGDNGMPSH